MRLIWQTPLFLLLFVPLAALGLMVYPWNARRYLSSTPLRQRRVLTTLRLAGLAFLVVAMAQPTWAASSSAIPTVVLADLSASVSSRARAAEAAVLRAAATPPVRAVVTFGGNARLSADPTGALSGEGVDRSQTDIARALQLAMGALPGGGRVLLLSDGGQTVGDADAAAAAARAHHLSIDTLPLDDGGVADAALTRLQAPAQVHQGDAVPLLLTVRSTVSRPATLTLTQDGRPLGQETLHLRVGDNPFLATLQAPGPGWHAYRALVTMGGDARPQNDALDTTTVVAARPSVLVVTTSRPADDSFVALLRRHGLLARSTSPHSLATSVNALARADAIVLDDIPAGDLGARQVAALDEAVRLRGVGLFVLGGPHSLTLGRYTDSPLERLLPVLSVTPGSLQQGTTALQLVLDRSGSMNDLAGDVPKILMAQSAANIAVDFALQHKDDLGLVSFDEVPHTLVPLQRVSGSRVASRLHAVVGGLTADGGTNIYAALQTGLTQVLRSAAPFKHIILMTDGRSEPANYNGLLRLMQQRQVTLSTIGLGQDADVDLLRALARAGKGRFYYTENAADLPRIFAEEARLSAGATRVSGTIPVAINAASPVVRSLTGGPLPPVHAYPATVLKPEAVAPLVARARGRGDDPLLAQWHYGLGRVLVWTPGLEQVSWSGGWLTGETTLWNDAVRWTLRGLPTPALQPRLAVGMPARITVDTLQNDGSFLDLARLEATVQMPRGGVRRVSFMQTGPARYEAQLSAAGPGIYRLTVTQAASSSRVSALVAVPYGAEYVPRPPDVALLNQLALATGGRVLATPRQAAALLSVGSAVQTDLWAWLVALALLLYLATLVLRMVVWADAPTASARQAHRP